MLFRSFLLHQVGNITAHILLTIHVGYLSYVIQFDYYDRENGSYVNGLESFDNLAFTQGEAAAPTEPESTEVPAEEPAEVPAEETAPTEPETPAAEEPAA